MNEGNRRIYEQNMGYLEQLGIGEKIVPIYDNFLKLRAALMCMGVGPSVLTRELAQIVNPSGEKRTGNVGLPVEFRSTYRNDNPDSRPFLLSLPTSVVYKGLQVGDRDFTVSSPFGLKGSVNNIALTLQGKKIIGLNLYEQPDWINQTTTSGKPMTAMFLPEAGDNLMGATRANGGCEYFGRKEACGFCGLDPLKGGDGKTPQDFAEVAAAAYAERPKTTSVTLTAGNTYTQIRGLEQYLRFIAAISQAVNAKGIKPWIEVEASPPDFERAGTEAYRTIDALIEAGVTSFISNMEQYSAKARASALPAKSKISYGDYATFFNYLREKRIPASSVLIVGLDDSDENIVQGAKFLTENGAYPIILPFRPRGKYGARDPINPNRLYNVSLEIADIVRAAGIFPLSPGCAKCGGCSMDVQATIRAYQRESLIGVEAVVR
ncbi:hypothetical protein HZA99_00025 [Candidatus Woesearchaeota archaeon]|nr:hypothetical protein [Candidatus Woesearchaeota archaeon]